MNPGENRKLYFFAVVPPHVIAQEVTAFKEEARQLFNAAHALKSPPHITLIPPFWMNNMQLDHLHKTTSNWANQQTPFYLNLVGFDCFAPRVIFIANEESNELADMQESLRRLTFDFHKKQKDARRPFHPHMTIAFKDLQRSVFKEAWAHFSQKEFRRSFKVDQLSLLIHRDRRWHMIKRYMLKG